ncbi:MAG TPA: (d)CMP kinase [Candidatus Babeliales bacterium]|nr:(d)CMP kinase [Candidatus Babeliales bacterium]
MIITIDGPVASGKSTVSRILAQKLGYYYLCSGLLYRALGYVLVNRYGYTLETIAEPSQEDIKHCFDPQKFSYHYDAHTQERIFFDNKDITAHLKDRFIDKIASIVSVNVRVRYAVTQLQRDIASKSDIVTDGRDVGSVVFPDAHVKFFITASVDVRAERWRKDQEKYGNHFSVDEAIAAITDRDDRDKNRTIAPLIIPDNAIVIDTSDLNVEQAVEQMIECVKNY